MDHRIRKRMQRLLRELDVRIPAPFTAEEFCRNLASAREREIHLVPWDTTRASVPCGLWISTEQADYVIYEQAAAAILREHIILHELGHLLLGHAGAVDLQGVLGTFDILDTSVVERVLGRTSSYDAREEREAEILASVIGEHPARYASEAQGQLSADAAAVVDRFGAALAADRRWR
ncbi:hypothetical protein ODJ79_39870 [Actinoplanes sp. KI2]|uniref:hypothetical protein n=1 Tax=Actinoplanes sp. KI2 TaxID=2983315 RepID=UPI0021D5D749|nr:hypothetical protein [Actinoplanes sp. KI2]MCU7729911.1 hypothetical protein [Actinoplanes sp. KI2]